MEVARKAAAWVMAFVMVVGMYPTAALAETGSLTGGNARDLVTSVGNDEGVDAEGYSLEYVESNGEISITGIVKDDADLAAGSSARKLSTLGTDDDGVEFTYELGTGADKNLVIPPTIEGKAVTAIGESAFENQNWIESVTIPSSVKVIGASAFKGCAGLKTASLAEGLELIGSYAFSETGLTAISVPKTAALASYAFADCDALAAVTLPEGVRFATAYYRSKESEYVDWQSDWYGDGDVFSDCDALVSVKIPASLGGVSSWMFADCDKLASVEIAEGITVIDDRAFYRCHSLASFNIPEGVTKVDYEAFYGCKPASTVTLPTTLASIGEEAFNWFADGYWDEDDNYVAGPEGYEIKTATWDQYWMLLGDPESQVSLYVNAKTTQVLEPDLEKESNAVLLYKENEVDGTLIVVGSTGRSADLVIPESSGGKTVSAIGDSAFKDANWIESVSIPSSVKSIESSAFRGCLRMRSVTLKEGLELIGSSAFSRTGLKLVSVPKTAALASYAFSGCDALATVTLPEGVRFATAYYRSKGSEYEDWQSDWYGDGGVFYDCDALVSVKIPASLGGVSNGMFSDCDKLASVEIAEGITVIDNYAFDGCDSLASFNIPEGVTKVGYDAFYGCKPASAVVLPSSLSSIQEGAFRWYSYGYYDDDDNYIAPRIFSISPSTWEQYWKLLGNSRYISVGSTTVTKPANAGSAQFDFKTVDNPDGTLTVTGYVACAAPPSKLEIPGKIGDKTVAAIGDGAFEDANWIASVAVPSSVKTIGDSVFRGSYSMKSVSLSRGLELIGGYAFAQTGLESVSVPDTAALSYYAFYGCESLASAVLPEGVRLASAYYREKYSGEGDDEDYEYDEDDDQEIFKSCSSLGSVRVPASLGDIPTGMFRYCDGLKTAEIAKGIASIGSYAFEGCSSLQDINLPEGVTSVGYEAFDSCRPASVVALPATLASIGEHAFRWYGYGWHYDDEGNWIEDSAYIIDTATWDQYWKLHENTRYINPDSTEVRAPIGAGQDVVELDWKVNDDGQTVTITGIKRSASRVIIPSFVEASSPSSQAAKTAAASVTAADDAKGYKVVAIGEGAFRDQSDIVSVVLPDTLERIEESAFAHCGALTDVLIPDSVKDIAERAFEDSDSVTFFCGSDSQAAAYAQEHNINTESQIPLRLATAELVGESVIDWDQGGSSVKPDVIVKIGEKTLSADEHYTVEYPENKVGNNYATINAVEGGGYSGETYAGYKIIASLAKAELGAIDQDDCVYYGSAVTPKPQVTLLGEKLREGRDIVYSWENNEAPGMATVIVNAVESSPYYGSISKQFSVVAQNEGNGESYGESYDESDDESDDEGPSIVSLSPAKVQLAGWSYTYSGMQIAPAVTRVTLNGVTVPASAYKVSYGQNVNAGVGTVTVTGQGSYTGSATASFTIAPAAQTITLGKAVAKKSKTFKRSKLKKAKSFKIGAVASGGGKLTYTLNKKAKKAKIKVNKKGKVTVPKKCKAGTYAITVKAAATANYQASAVKVTIKVKK